MEPLKSDRRVLSKKFREAKLEEGVGAIDNLLHRVSVENCIKNFIVE